MLTIGKISNFRKTTRYAADRNGGFVNLILVTISNIASHGLKHTLKTARNVIAVSALDKDQPDFVNSRVFMDKEWLAESVALAAQFEPAVLNIPLEKRLKSSFVGIPNFPENDYWSSISKALKEFRPKIAIYTSGFEYGGANTVVNAVVNSIPGDNILLVETAPSEKPILEKPLPNLLTIRPNRIERQSSKSGKTRLLYLISTSISDGFLIGINSREFLELVRSHSKSLKMNSKISAFFFCEDYTLFNKDISLGRQFGDVITKDLDFIFSDNQEYLDKLQKLALGSRAKYVKFDIPLSKNIDKTLEQKVNNLIQFHSFGPGDPRVKKDY